MNLLSSEMSANTSQLVSALLSVGRLVCLSTLHLGYAEHIHVEPAVSPNLLHAQVTLGPSQLYTLMQCVLALIAGFL